MEIEAATVETLSWIGSVHHSPERDIKVFLENCAVGD
jgi:hypothetical protein